MQNRIRRAFNCVRERTCVSYAKIATMGGLGDVNLIITKATSHDDFPLQDRYVHDLLKIFSFSPATCSAFALAFARRFRKTQSWRVALKCLLLLHRLLPSAPGLRADLLWARTNGMLSLYPCTFRDRTSSASHHYTAFIAAYARLLDEALDCVVVEGNKVDDDDDEDDAPRKLEELGRMIEILPQLQSLIDRAIECWPVGAASRSFLVHSAMKHVIRDSNWRYAAFRREIVVVLENLIQLPYRSCVAAFQIYKKAAAQADQLAGFHEWCKNMGYCGSYEYPYIDRIPDIQIRALETFLNGMWQLTDQSSNTTVSDEQSPVSSRDNGGGERPDDVADDRRDVEVEPLIKWEVEESSGGWEDLLEASIHSNGCMDSRNGWQIELYNPYGFQTPNPFYHQQPNHRTYYGSCPNTPLQHPWLGVGVYDATCA